jgi:hypothetical protein
LLPAQKLQKLQDPALTVGLLTVGLWSALLLLAEGRL